MKLAIICRPYVFHGGIETATAGLIDELARQGHAVDLITTAGQKEVPGVTVCRLPTLRHPSVLRLLSFGLAARRVARSGAYEIVQSHERVFLQDIYRAGEGCHRAYLRAMGRSGAQVNPYHRVVLGLEKRIFGLRTARHVVAISNRSKAEIERLYATPAGRVTVVYNGVDLSRFHPDNRQRLGKAAREEFGLAAGDRVILFVGSGFERKGLGPLIEAMARLRPSDSRLVVAGKGDARPYRTLAARLGVDDLLRWAGPVERVERLYAAADVVALPARYEPFGNVHLEALASGVPVLTSGAAGGAEVVRPGLNGWVVGAPEPGLIAEGLEAIRDLDPAALGSAAREAAEPFTYGAQADRLIALYRQLMR